MNKLLEIYINNKIPVFPVNAKTKAPLTKNGFKDATTEIDQINGWIDTLDCGWGIPTGKASGLLVIDVDAKNGGLQHWQDLVDEHGDLETIEQRTQNGGRHLLFKYPNTKVRCSAGKIAEGVDVRGTGGYIVAPPTPGYEWTNGFDFETLPEAPEWLLEKAIPRSITSIETENFINDGTRNVTLFTRANSLYKAGMNDEDVLAHVLALNEEKCVPPIEQSEVECIVQSAVSYEKTKFDQQDLANAVRFKNRYDGEAVYIYMTDEWFVWDGKRWKADAGGMIDKMAHDTAMSIYIEAGLATNTKEAERLSKWARVSCFDNRLNGMVRRARPLMQSELTKFDQAPYLLNIQNGTIDLKTGELHSHSKEDYLTKLIDVIYDPDADCPEWKAFLNEIMANNEENVRWIQKAIGASATGSGAEQVLIFLYGRSGANGKSTFLATMQQFLGEYSQKTPIDSLMITKYKDGQAASPYTVRLRGARFVVTDEVQQDRRMNAALIKTLTGGERLIGRGLRKDPIEFEPTHLLWMYGNHKPRIADETDAMWRRMRVLPFPVTIPEEKQIPMPELIDKFKMEFSGILNWTIEGALIWKEERLGFTPDIRFETEQYKTEQDEFQQFLDDCCTFGPDLTTHKISLYEDYNDWCKENGIKFPKKKTWVTRRLKEKGVVDIDRNYYGGVEIAIPTA